MKWASRDKNNWIEVIMKIKNRNKNKNKRFWSYVCIRKPFSSKSNTLPIILSLGSLGIAEIR